MLKDDISILVLNRDLSSTILDAVKANEVIETLMGEEVPPRKAFIQAHALKVRNLDV